MRRRGGNIESGASAGALAVAAFAFFSQAHAQDIDVEVEGEASIVAGVSDGEGRADADARVEVTGSTILDNGVEVGAVVGARVDGQQPDQLFSGGRYTSLLTGGARGVGPDGGDAFVEQAYAYARGAFGQVSVGREQGVARAFAVTAPTIFRAINVNDWRTDLSGLNDVHTINDFSGYSTKITYLPPANFLGGALGGLQLGVSYSPNLRECGEALCAPVEGFAQAPDGSLLSTSSNYENVFETALYFQKKIDENLLVGLGATYLSADEDVRSVTPLFDDYEAYSFGLNLAYRGITLGGSIISTNGGLSSIENDNDGYLAFDAGVTFRTGEDRGDWGVMLGYGHSEASAFGPNLLDADLYQDTNTAQAGVTYFLGRGVTIGAAAQFVEANRPEAAGGPEEAATVVIESSIRF